MGLVLKGAAAGGCCCPFECSVLERVFLVVRVVCHEWPLIFYPGPETVGLNLTSFPKFPSKGPESMPDSEKWAQHRMLCRDGPWEAQGAHTGQQGLDSSAWKSGRGF